MIVTLTANPSLDRTYQLSELRRGGVHRAADCWTEPSGKGVNVSRALAVNGHATVAVLPAGGAVGAELVQRLHDEGLTFVAVQISNGIRSNVTLLEPDGVTTKINEGGPKLDPAEIALLFDTAAREASSARWVVGSGSLPEGAPGEFYGELKSRLGELPLAVDASGEALQHAIRAGVALVKPNRTELEEAIGRSARTLGDVVDHATRLRDAGVGSVLVSLGADGAVFVGDEIVLHGEARLDRVRTTAGAGDALLAGFLATPDGARSSLERGLRWAATRCQDLGPQMSPSGSVIVEMHERISYDRVLRANGD